MKVDQATETTDLGVNIKQEYVESIALSKQPRRKRCKYYSIPFHHKLMMQLNS